MEKLSLKAGTSWEEVYARCLSTAPEAFDREGPRNLIGGEWRRIGVRVSHTSPLDGTEVPGAARIGADQAAGAVGHAVDEHRRWSRVDVGERRHRVAEAVEALTAHRELLALLLVWEIGKPWRLAMADVDRCTDGVTWYLGEIERQLGSATGLVRKPLSGPVSNIASWNYPMSVQVHGELVQVLAGNGVIAKAPSQGGVHALTLAHALMRRAGLPVTLVSGTGAQLGDVLVGSEGIGAVAFVGGRTNGSKAALALADTKRRHIFEQEGLNAWGVWEFSNWSLFGQYLAKGFEYAKQRCTAYPRYVVQRRLVPAFLDTYLAAVASLKFGHPLAVNDPNDQFPELSFGPVISAAKAARLEEQFDEALRGGAVPIYQGSLADGAFIDGQDTSAYVAPAAVLGPAPSWSLQHAEPFGPLDSVVVVDTEAELVAAMNASNGCLVASVATDDVLNGERLAGQVQAFKVGINAPRSRGDREEVFGGAGGSWRGAFVGGDLLVDAVTVGPGGGDEGLYGNFPSYSRFPAR